jgi:hypothetical protein
MVRVRALVAHCWRDDLPRQHQFNNDIAVQLAGGGDPPMPQSLERLQAEFGATAGQGGRDGLSFAIGGRRLPSAAARCFTSIRAQGMLGIGIGDKDYWARVRT